MGFFFGKASAFSLKPVHFPMRAKNKTREARLCWESFDCEGIVRVTHEAS